MASQLDPYEIRSWFEEVLRPQGPIKWQGDEGKCRCPLHEDKNPSFAVNATKGTWVCHAGCGGGGLKDLAARLGVEPPWANHKPIPPRETLYDYLDQAGVLTFQVVRQDSRDGKKIFQRRPDGNGGWVNNMKGVRAFPYRLPELLEALKLDKIVFVAEGEKCVDRLCALGLVATTNHGGAKKWRDDLHSSWFPPKARVHILPDSDEPGQEHARIVARSLKARGVQVKILDLGYPVGDGKGKDIVDWLDAGHTIEDLREIIRNTEPWEGTQKETENTLDFTETEPTEDAPSTPPKKRRDSASWKMVGGYEMNDIGNAERLVKKHGKNLRYCARWRKWLAWDGRKWSEDAPHLVVRLAVDTIRSMYPEADSISDTMDRKDFLDFVNLSGRKGRLDGLISIAQAGEGIPVETGELDADKWKLNLKSGTLNLNSGEVTPHTREDLITKLAPVVYDPAAKSPTWDAFLYRIFGGDEDLIGFIQRAVGYSLTGDTREHCLFVLYGTGRNGKSTFLNVIRFLLADYAKQASADTFMQKKTSSGPGDDVAMLRGARFVTAIETEETQRLAESLVKQLTGGDTVSCRRLYENFFEFDPEFKIWLATNHKPNIRGTDEGIWRRIRLIPFNVRIPDEEADKELTVKLKNELPGILNWALRGCVDWQKGGLQEPESVLLATEEYRKEMDALGAWLSESCVFGKDCSEFAGALYKNYQEWCEINGERVFSQRMLAKRLTERGFWQHKGTKGSRKWYGLQLGNPDGYWPSGASGAYGIEEAASATQKNLANTGEVALVAQVALKYNETPIGENTLKTGYMDPHIEPSRAHIENFPRGLSATSATFPTSARLVSIGDFDSMRHPADPEAPLLQQPQGLEAFPWSDDPEERSAIQDEQ